MDVTFDRARLEARMAERGENTTTVAAGIGCTAAAVKRWIDGTAVPGGKLAFLLHRHLKLRPTDLWEAP